MGNAADHNIENNKKGFTLIEILVVLAITAVLSSLAIVYTHVGQNQISLSIEESKVAQLILEAKELSLATYSDNSATCAYGVAFNYASTAASSTYSLFAYNAATTNLPGYGGRQICPSLASTSIAFDTSTFQKYQSGSWQVHTARGVVLDDSGGSASDTIQYILFFPPNPCTLISFDGNIFHSDCSSITSPPPSGAHVYLKTADGSMSRTITVNPAGQVSL